MLPNPEAATYYKTTTFDGENAGVDLHVPTKVIFAPGEKKLVNMGVRAVVIDGDALKHYREMQGISGNDVKSMTSHYREMQGISGNDVKSMSSHYWMLPRSSISKTGLMMLNSVGVIDKSYRGELMAFLWNTTNSTIVVEAGNRLVQIVAGDMSDITSMTVVDRLPTSTRDEGGFGSTGK